VVVLQQQMVQTVLLLELVYLLLQRVAVRAVHQLVLVAVVVAVVAHQRAVQGQRYKVAQVAQVQAMVLAVQVVVVVR
jgi:hypothetical protein